MNSDLVSVDHFKRRNETSGEQRVAANENKLVNLTNLMILTTPAM